MAPDMKRISEALVKGDQSAVKEAVGKCLQEGIDPGLILQKGLIAGMEIVGERFKKDEIFMPELLIAARAMHAGLDLLDPILSKSGVERTGKLVLGTVRNDLHDVGKNIVSMMFRGTGFEVIDLGIDVPEERFVQAIAEHAPDVVGLSALVSMTMPMMESTIRKIEESNLRGKVIIMVGGAPVTQKFADRIGADGYAPDAASAVDTAKELMRAHERSEN
jgi:5-methyltetrahydrofolate--homocysteine methyltransferase